jgi:hypothetical protein
MGRGKGRGGSLLGLVKIGKATISGRGILKNCVRKG